MEKYWNINIDRSDIWQSKRDLYSILIHIMFIQLPDIAAFDIYPSASFHISRISSFSTFVIARCHTVFSRHYTWFRWRIWNRIHHSIFADFRTFFFLFNLLVWVIDLDVIPTKTSAITLRIRSFITSKNLFRADRQGGKKHLQFLMSSIVLFFIFWKCCRNGCKKEKNASPITVIK